MARQLEVPVNLVTQINNGQRATTADTALIINDIDRLATRRIGF